MPSDEHRVIIAQQFHRLIWMTAVLFVVVAAAGTFAYVRQSQVIHGNQARIKGNRQLGIDNRKIIRRLQVTEQRNRQALVILCEQATILASIADDTARAIRLAVANAARLKIADRLDLDVLTLQSEPACELAGIQ